mmetsp:Transcript_21297/g.54183  ORF Transcript_21297/g.54183 Transcript_21297/m.54183 type:complete len:205 (-) Transcript_21297:74-688(-)
MMGAACAAALRGSARSPPSDVSTTFMVELLELAWCTWPCPPSGHPLPVLELRVLAEMLPTAGPPLRLVVELPPPSFSALAVCDTMGLPTRKGDSSANASSAGCCCGGGCFCPLPLAPPPCIVGEGWEPGVHMPASGDVTAAAAATAAAPAAAKGVRGAVAEAPPPGLDKGVMAGKGWLDADPPLFHTLPADCLCCATPGGCAEL